MAEEKGKRRQPETQTPDRRQEQLRKGKAAQRERDAAAGKARIDAVVSVEAKARLEAYREVHDLKSIGVALDAILLKINVDRST